MTKHSYTSATPEPGTKASTFDVDDVEFTCKGQVSILDLSEFARLATQGIDSESPEGVAILADVFLALLGEVEYRRFRNHCRKHSTDGETLVRIIGDMIAEMSERPTSRPSSSPDGPPPTGATAKVVSFSRGTVVETTQLPKLEAETETTPAPAVVSYG